MASGIDPRDAPLVPDYVPEDWAARYGPVRPSEAAQPPAAGQRREAAIRPWLVLWLGVMGAVVLATALAAGSLAGIVLMALLAAAGAISGVLFARLTLRQRRPGRRRTQRPRPRPGDGP